MQEKWMGIPGYEAIYEASSDGRVRRITDATQARSYAGRILKPIHQHTGYQTVTLYKNGIPTMFLLHRVIASAFHGLCPDGLQVNHIDGDKTNNNSENIEYVTASANNSHAYRIGLKHLGQSHHQAKLTDKEVLDIVREVSSGISQYSAASRRNITQANVSSIMTGNTWSHLTGITRRTK